jgi:hypothetical protein
MPSARAMLLPGVFFGAAIVSGCAPARAAVTNRTPDTDIAVYALSRGEGVPDAARQALSAARALFAKWGAEGRVLDLADTPFGFEGDTRLCARFATPVDATSALKELDDLGRGIELFQVKTEPCAHPSL